MHSTGKLLILLRIPKLIFMNTNQLKQPSQLVFRQFSRKKYAAFNSLGKSIKISALGAACALIASPVQSQSKSESDSISTKVDLEEVEVVGQKSTVLIDELPRMVEVIDARSIKQAPGQSFQDLIQYGSNIDISQRGQFGIQSDVSIRGGSFDQVLILQNGINLTDPQTGHHNLNLPIDHESIYKIEILNGPAARALGANAFTGAINVVTRPSWERSVSASVNVGEYGYFRGHLGVNHSTKNTRHLLSASYSKSDGYTDNTDFEVYNLHYHGMYKLGNNAAAHLQAGINDKSFGANGFYTPIFPAQYEETQTFYLNAGISSGSTLKSKTDIYWRRHTDMFTLFREGNDYYRYEDNGLVINNKVPYDTGFYYVNRHLTDIFGANHTSKYRSRFGTTAFGANLRSENLLSNALGKDIAVPIPITGEDDQYYTKQDFRNSFDLFAEHAYQSEKWFLSAGALLHWNSFDPQKLNFVPGVDASFTPVGFLSVVASYNYTVGHPTFTDLTYQGPTNKGNENLRPYYQHSGEAGLKYHGRNIQSSLVYFAAQGNNNIDWVRNDSTNRFLAMNVNKTSNVGIEWSFRYKTEGSAPLERLLSEIYMGYTYINTYRDLPAGFSKYSNVRQKFVARLNQNIVGGFSLSWNVMYKERIGNYVGFDFTEGTYTYNPYPAVWLVDLRASYQFIGFTVYAEVANLLDETYVESGSIPQPGRWFKGGISYRFGY